MFGVAAAIAICKRIDAFPSRSMISHSSLFFETRAKRLNCTGKGRKGNQFFPIHPFSFFLVYSHEVLEAEKLN
jgi:hypothetical protein